ncbi:hypothetical protein ACR2XN_28790, partial [Klebsiella pneumoniae]
DHLSRLEDHGGNSKDKTLINEFFPDDQLFGAQDEGPWFADIVNYLVSNVIPEEFSYAQRKKFLHDVKWYCWDEPFLFRQGADRSKYSRKTKSSLFLIRKEYFLNLI